MRVVMVSKALVAGAYQRKAEEIARLGVDLTVLVPPVWGDRRGDQAAEQRYVAGYAYRVIPIRFNGAFHWHYYPTLARELARLRPQLLHMDEEPYNLATWLGLRAAHKLGIASLFFTWQNLARHYPPPFCWFEQQNYHMAAAAIAGSREAATVLQRKGCTIPLSVIPQFGVDTEIYAPAPAGRASGPLRIGYAGGLLPEKGIDLLLRSCAALQGEWRLALAGEGEARGELEALARQLDIAAQVDFAGRKSGEQMIPFYRQLDVLVLPSRTTPRWKEQFGRVLIEAMACQVAVIGSASGEIPHVIGTAGMVVPENDPAALAAALQRLLDDPPARAQLAAAGRQRVLHCFTMAQVAQQSVALYRQLLAGGRADLAQR
jgi:glycosyltransferase involved in cell wall biosynthesis